MSPLRYLTVQDVLWMNLQLTKRVNHYSAARLEEATHYQYAYGEATGVVAQAARLLSGFSRLRPLEVGNDATALLATLTFLELNGHTADLNEDEIGPWTRDAARCLDQARRAISTCVHPKSDEHGDGSGPGVREVVADLLARYPDLATRLPDSVPA